MRVYTVQDSRAVSTAITVLQVTAPSTMVLKILKAWVNQESTTTSVQAPWQVLRKSSAATGTTTVTPVKLDPGDPSSSVTAGRTATGEGTDSDVLYRAGFNYLNGDNAWPTPDEQIYVAPSGIIAIKFPSAPTSATFNYGFTFAEIG